MNAENTDPKVVDILGSHKPEFNTGFTNRVMERIAGLETDVLSIFKWIAFSGVAAIIVLLLTIYLTEGSFNTDAIFGIYNYSEEESLITAYNF